MENLTTWSTLVTISTATEEIDNSGKGRESIYRKFYNPNVLNEKDGNQFSEKFTLPMFSMFSLNNSPERMPDYRKHLAKVFVEEFVAKATKQDRSLTPVMKMIRDKDCES